MDSYIDPTALSYWFPIVEATGVPVPKTLLLDMPEAAQKSIWAAFDGLDEGSEHIKVFASRIAAAADTIGWPFFLRTDHTSGKHNWNHTCFVQDRDRLVAHIFGLAEYSEMAGFLGLRWDRWAVREMLPIKPYGVCRGYADMPINREFRFFVSDGEIVCRHPYWPEKALEQGRAEFADGMDVAALNSLEGLSELDAIACRVGKALGGSWSIDLLETERGWYVTDLAEAHKSFHWQGCPHTFPRPAKVTS